MGRRAAKKAKKQQKQEIAQSEALAQQKEEELRAERERIFRASKPAQETASFQFGIQDRGDMQTYSDFGGFSEFFVEDEEQSMSSPQSMTVNPLGTDLFSLLGGV